MQSPLGINRISLFELRWCFVRRERDLRVIRPFIYVREKALRQFAEGKGLPIIPENCPACFEAPKVRLFFLPNLDMFRTVNVHSFRDRDTGSATLRQVD